MAKRRKEGQAGKKAQRSEAKESARLSESELQQQPVQDRPETPPARVVLPLAGSPITPDHGSLKNAVLSLRLRKALPPDDLKELQALQSHAASSSKIDDDRQATVINLRAQQLADSYKQIKATQMNTESQLAAVDALLVGLKAKMDDGTLNLVQGQYDEERESLQEQQMKLRIDSSVLRSMGAQLSGQWVDDLALGSREALEDWALIDAAIRTYPEVGHGKKSLKPKRAPSKESLFRTRLIKAYDASDDKTTMFWCPVAGDFVHNAVAAHVVNFHVGEHMVRAVFGEKDEDHLWTAKNGLLVAKDYEKLIDSAKAVILPSSDNPDELIFHLLSHDIGRKSGHIPWDGELQGRKLVFRNAFRPSKKYLYFKFVMSILRRRRAEVPGFLNDLDALPDHSKTLWASPGPYMKRSVLYKFARQFGCLSATEASRFWGADVVPMEPLEAEADDISTTVATLATVGLHGTLQQDGGSANDNAEEEDEDDEDDAEEEYDEDV